MNKKVFVVILVASILALISAFCIINKVDSSKPIKSESVSQENFYNTDSNITEEKKEELTQEDFQVENKLEESKQSKESSNVAETAKIIKPIVNDETPNFDQIVVQEASIIEEVEDYGIFKDEKTGVVEITRDFKQKSPTKYSFDYFGLVNNISR